MMFLYRSSSSTQPVGRSPLRSGMLSLGLLMLFFGILVFIAPELINYLIASFFTVTGISLIIAWWRLR